jgi:5-methylcytosine-specific restriction protein A
VIHVSPLTVALPQTHRNHSYEGTGMSNASRTDKRVFEALHADPTRVAEIANAIRANSEVISPIPADEESDPDFSAVEGRLLFRRHRARERNSHVRGKKISMVLGSGGNLSCEVCGVGFGDAYEPLGEGYIEVHHRLPLATGVRTTRLEDLALVCPNCHRTAHRGMGTPVEASRQTVEKQKLSDETAKMERIAARDLGECLTLDVLHSTGSAELSVLRSSGI